MLQHLLRRLVFDVPILNEYAKMPLKVWLIFIQSNFLLNRSEGNHFYMLLKNKELITGGLFPLYLLLPQTNCTSPSAADQSL